MKLFRKKLSIGILITRIKIILTVLFLLSFFYSLTNVASAQVSGYSKIDKAPSGCTGFIDVGNKRIGLDNQKWECEGDSVVKRTVSWCWDPKNSFSCSETKKTDCKAYNPLATCKKYDDPYDIDLGGPSCAGCFVPNSSPSPTPTPDKRPVCPIYPNEPGYSPDYSLGDACKWESTAYKSPLNNKKCCYNASSKIEPEKSPSPTSRPTPNIPDCLPPNCIPTKTPAPTTPASRGVIPTAAPTRVPTPTPTLTLEEELSKQFCANNNGIKEYLGYRCNGYTLGDTRACISPLTAASYTDVFKCNDDTTKEYSCLTEKCRLTNGCVTRTDLWCPAAPTPEPSPSPVAGSGRTTRKLPGDTCNADSECFSNTCMPAVNSTNKYCVSSLGVRYCEEKGQEVTGPNIYASCPKN